MGSVDRISLEKFDQVKNDNFDQLPNLTENFDQVKRSSEIRSSEQLPNWNQYHVLQKWPPTLLHN